MAKLPSSTAFGFAAWFSAAFTVLILVLGAAIYWAIRNELRYELDQRVATTREAVLREATDDDTGLFRVIATRAGRPSGDMRYALFDAKGTQIAGQPVATTPRLGWSAIDFVEPSGHPDKTWVLASEVAGGGTLVVGADSEALEELDDRMVPMFIAAFGLIAAIGVAGALFLSRVLQRRLDTMNRTAEAIIAGDMASRINLSGRGDEFDRLSATLNQMLDRIADLLDNLRQVSSDIAHDLRTPLTRLRQKLEFAVAGPTDAITLEESVHQALEQTDDILALFAGILDISEIEAGGAGVRMQTVDLSGLVAVLADSYQPSVEDTGRVLLRDIAQGITIEGNRELLAQAGVNLLDNALRHTVDGTVVEISLSQTEETVLFSVGDHGAGIPLEDRERVFARFTRLESSRSTPGHGLGLSLVAAIARAHGGTAILHDNKPGAAVMLTLPRKPR